VRAIVVLCDATEKFCFAISVVNVQSIAMIAPPTFVSRKLNWETQSKKSARDRRSLRRDREVLLCHERRQPLVDRDDRAADLGEADGAGDVGHEASDELVARRARL
jgi:hypothetical protein